MMPHSSQAANIDALDRHRRPAGTQPICARSPIGPELTAADRLGPDRHHLHAFFRSARPQAAVIASGRHRAPAAEHANLSGVYDSRQARGRSAVLQRCATVPVPHSRRGDIAESDLVAQGYRVLARL